MNDFVSLSCWCYFYQASVSSSENKTQLDCEIAKGAVKPSEKLKLYLHDNITGKKVNTLVSSKRTPKTRNFNSNYVSSHRQHTDVCSSASVLHNSLARDRSVTSPISIAGEVKANSATKGFLDNVPTKLPLHARTYQVDILVNFILELQLASVLMVSPTGHLFMQSTIKETAVTGGLRKKALDNRRSGFTDKKTYTYVSLPSSFSPQNLPHKLELLTWIIFRSFGGDGIKLLDPSECQIRPKGQVTKNQRPKVM
jgi:hypothetical protein